MTSTLPPLTFRLTGEYLSISNLLWENVPPLAIVTGINGAGKSQLLEGLFAGLAGAGSLPQHRRSFSISTDIVPDSITGSDVVYIPAHSSFSPPSAVTIQHVRNEAKQIWESLCRTRSTPHEWIRPYAEEALGRPIDRLSEEEFLDFATEHPVVFFKHRNLLHGLGEVFLTFRNQMFQLIEGGASREEASKELGPPPWTVLNDILASVNFPYRVASPEGTSLLSQYAFNLIATDHDKELRPEDLSSGEQQILSMVLWLYRSRHGALPKLLLLDEPDAYLHPSLTRAFLTALSEVLVTKHHVRVIITTHSPSTVALAPQGSLFEMQKGEPRLVYSDSKWRTVGLLTSGFVAVGPDSKYVFVEDEFDREFYQTLYDLLKRGPLLDLK